VTLAADLERAREGLRRAATILRSHAGDDVPYRLKGGTSPVTAADVEVDGMLRDLLPLPGDGWLSEETDDDARRLGCRRIWIVDPLDGTRSFVANRPEYATSIALVVDGEPVLGAIGNPATGYCVSGARGLGVAVEGARQLPWPRAAAALHVLVSRSEWKRGEWSHLAAADCTALPLGSVAYKLALVAGGAADATVTLHPKHEWDVAAGAALVREAGGEVWLPRGGHLLWNRRRPRFLSFAAARAGLQARIAALSPPPPA